MTVSAFDTPSAELHLLVTGVPLLEEMAVRLRHIGVESHVNLPSVCEVELSDPDQLMLEETRLIPGMFVEVRAVSSDNPIGVPIFSGQVESVEARYDRSGLRSVVRAFDPGHRLTKSTNTRGFPLSNYAEIAELIGLMHELPTVAVPDPVIHEMVVQANETDWDFLVRLATEIGYVLTVQLDPLVGLPTLRFGPPTPAEEAPPPIGIELSPRALEAGDERILSLRASVTASGLATLASTRGWDARLGLPAVGEGVPEDLTSLNELPPLELATELAAGASRVDLTRLAANELEAELASEGLAMRMAGAYAHIEMTVRGNPYLQPNSAISIAKFGLLTGEYTVTAAMHAFTPGAGGFTSRVVCSGREDRTLRGLAGAVKPSPRLTGVYPAIVTDVEDPEGLGRVLLSLPWLSETFVTPWARVVQAGAGPLTGAQILPEPLDEVLVAFENGQLDSPYVLGGLYNEERRGAIGATQLVQGVTVKRAFTSRAGHQIIFDDSPETPGLVLNTTFGASCMIRMSPETGITIATVEGQPVTIESASEVTVAAEAAVIINAAEITINGEGAVAINAEGAVEVNGVAVSITAEEALEIGAAEVSITAGVVNVAGGIVNLGA